MGETGAMCWLKVITMCLLIALTLAQVPPVKELQIEVVEAVAEENCKIKTKNGDTVHMHYTGKLHDGGKEFDSSIPRGQPLSFALGTGRVIQGWDQGLLDMCVGEKRKLTIPPELGYGSRGAGNVIPPDAALVFTVELIKIDRAREL